MSEPLWLDVNALTDNTVVALICRWYNEGRLVTDAAAIAAFRGDLAKEAARLPRRAPPAPSEAAIEAALAKIDFGRPVSPLHLDSMEDSVVEALRAAYAVDAPRAPSEAERSFFARCWALAVEARDIEASDVQDWGYQLGLLTRTTAQAPCGPDCLCEEYVGISGFPTDCYHLAGAAPQQEPSQIGWLIEAQHPEAPGPFYWTGAALDGTAFSASNVDAIRFSRCEDADNVRRHIRSERHLSIVLHSWAPAAPAPPEPT